MIDSGANRRDPVSPALFPYAAGCAWASPTSEVYP
jgi:hypothetical protein